MPIMHALHDQAGFEFDDKSIIHDSCKIRPLENFLSYSIYYSSHVLAAPSSPPMAVLPLMVTATSLTLTWQPPSFESRNGVIQQYIIQIEEINTGRMLTAISNTTEVSINNLHPFYSYSCRIAAETAQVGPYTTPITIQLDEDGKIEY